MKFTTVSITSEFSLVNLPYNLYKYGFWQFKGYFVG